jgi:hypothetical protein
MSISMLGCFVSVLQYAFPPLLIQTLEQKIIIAKKSVDSIYHPQKGVTLEINIEYETNYRGD